MKFSKKTFLLSLITIACALPVIAVHESNSKSAEEITQENDNSPLVDPDHKRIYRPESFNLTFNENGPATVTINNTTYFLSPENTEFAFDMDDVILHINWTGMSWEIAKNLPDAALIGFRASKDWIKSKVSKTRTRGKTLQLVSDLRELSRSGSAGGAYAQRLEQYKKGLGSVVNNVAMKKDVIPGMHKILLTLRQSNFTLRPATNQSVEELDQNKKRLPELFNLFEEGTAVNYRVRRNQPVVKKPNPEFFQAHIKNYNIKTPANPEGSKINVFVDDKKENVEKAAELGMIAIHFINPRKLVKDLQALGIPVPSKWNEFK